ncbi:uncharacterized protein LOC112681357 [Sipha flava]|uniref:ATP-dependent DNA helicase n=1 Tax=Sipha flava TaxID=143950 RepID=A0A8B8FAM9_9HEMI|nr:uncharacterized protein LOC112681357 [Sipha flava]
MVSGGRSMTRGHYFFDHRTDTVPERDINENQIFFIVDEALMVSVYALMVVKRLSKYVMENGFFSVGKVIVLGLGGDFRQVLPVVPHGSRLLTIQSRQEKTFLSLNTVSKECYNFLFPTEFLDNLHLSDLPPHSMILKQAMVVLLKFNVDSNLMNGTRFTVRNMYDQSLDLESITGQTTDQCILLPKIDLTPSDSTLPFSFTRRQFPIRIAFAMTINKVKGQTFNKV